MSDLHTPGRFITLWRLIQLIDSYDEGEGLSIKAIVEIIKTSGIMGGTIPITDGVKLGQEYQLLLVKNGVVTLTELSKLHFVPLCNTQEPNVQVLRSLIRHVLIKHRFHWILYFGDNVDVFKVAIPSIWIDLFDSADLFSIDQEDVNEWWTKVLQELQRVESQRQKQIGDVGEQLTVEHEKRRLTEDGFIKSHLYVKWMSKLDGKSGYDVSSIRGSLLLRNGKDKEQIFIEVKSSVFPRKDRFRFLVTRNEWNTAMNVLDHYFFYCWSGINLKNETAFAGPFIIPATSLVRYVPNDVDTNVCEWSECRFEIDLAAHIS